MRTIDGPTPRDGSDAQSAAHGWEPPPFLVRTIGSFDQRRMTAVIAAAVALVGFLLRWTQDDSFITLRYARNLVEGNGLVYNPGEYVEGYTNFLWTVLMAVPLWLGIDPVMTGHLLGAVAAVCTVVGVVGIATAVFGSHLLGNLVALVLASNFSFVAYVTGGLETQLQTALLVAVWLLLTPAALRDDVRISTARWALVSVACAAALMTRLDSLLLLAVPILAVVWRQHRARALSAPSVVAAVAPAALILTPWTIWRFVTYGSIVPNTAVAKSNPWSITVLQAGTYLAIFLAVSLIALFLPAALVRGRELLARRPFVIVAISLGLWVLYLFRVGADFMEFRFMVPVLPLISLVLVGLLLLTRTPRWRTVLGVSLALGFVVHPLIMGGSGGLLNIDSTGYLDGFVTDESGGLAQVGRELGEALGGSAEAELPGSGAPIISTGGAGALPYYARLRHVDQLGLTDPWTARNGLRTNTGRLVPKPGHGRVATIQHLLEEDVTLVIGGRGEPRPEGYGASDVRRMFWEAEVDVENLPSTASVLEIPVSEDVMFDALYLTPHPTVEKAINSGRWVRRDLDLSD